MKCLYNKLSYSVHYKVILNYILATRTFTLNKIYECYKPPVTICLISIDKKDILA